MISFSVCFHRDRPKVEVERNPREPAVVPEGLDNLFKLDSVCFLLQGFIDMNQM